MVNKVILIGNLGQEPELKYTPSGKACTTLSLATTEKWRDNNGQNQETTEWHRVVLWGTQAENAVKYLSKGRTVYVEGKNATRNWEDKATGQKKYVTEVIAKTINFIGGGNGQQQGGQQGRNQQGQRPQQGQQQGFQQNTMSTPDLGDIPF